MILSGDLNSSSRKSPQFGSPTATRDIKFRASQLKTNYKEGADNETTPYKQVFGRSEFREETSNKNTFNDSNRKRQASTGRKKEAEIESDPALDKIQNRIKEIGNRLQQIHKQAIGKEPNEALQSERRQLRKELIQQDFDHKMICAKKHIYGKYSPGSSYTSASTRLAQIQTELALSRSRRLRQLQTDLVLYDYYLDWPSYYDYYTYRPWRLYSYWDRYLSYPFSTYSRYSYLSYPYYSSLLWL